MTKNELAGQLSSCAALVKTVCGVANNAAWMCCLDAHDKIKRHSRYAHNTKRQYKIAFEEFHHYERSLVYASNNRMFHVADMPPETRQVFGDITDREYYEFWAACGAQAYMNTRPLITSLVNKYRLALLHLGASEAELLAWPMAALACLNLAVGIHHNILWPLPPRFTLRENVVRSIFHKFSLKRVALAWSKAVQLTDPETYSLEFNTTDCKNIHQGIEQLMEAWTEAEVLYQSRRETIATYDEIFRTKAEQKKAMRETRVMQHYVENEMN